MSERPVQLSFGLPMLPPPAHSNPILLEGPRDIVSIASNAFDTVEVDRLLIPVVTNAKSRYATYFEYLQESDKSWIDAPNDVRVIEQWKSSYSEGIQSHFKIFSRWSRGLDYIHEQSFHFVFEKSKLSRMTVALFSVFLSSSAMSFIFSIGSFAENSAGLSFSTYITLLIATMSGLACSERVQKEIAG